MDLKRKREQGLTLAELLIATFLMSVVFVGVTAAYISALKLFQKMQLNAGGEDTISTNDQYIALEHVVRRARLANKVVLGESGNPFDSLDLTKTYQQVKFRLDYNPATLAPNNSPTGTTSDTSDDQWVKYRFFQVSGVWKLLWKTGTAEAGDVTASDPEVQPNLKVTNYPASYFKAEAAASPGTPPGAVSVALNALVGDPERVFSLVTAVWTHMRTDAS